MARAASRPRGEGGALWTPDDLELFLQTTAAPPTTSDDVFLKSDTATTTNSSSPSHQSEDTTPDSAVDVANELLELDAAAKRLRRTEIERLSRRRRQASLRAMRDEVRVLETKFAGLMDGHAMRRKSAGIKSENPFDSDDRTPLDDDIDGESMSELKFSEEIRRLRERFIELKLYEGDLEQEQKDLQRSLRSKQLLAMSVQSVAFSSVRTWSDPEQPSPAAELQFKFHPAEEYARLMRGAYDELRSLEASKTFESLGSNCMGWSDRRVVDDAGLVFSLTKTFQGREAAPIMLTSWDVFSTESRLRESFGARGINMQLHVLDRPSDDILVLHRSNIRRGCKGERRHHVVYLLFRVQTDDGFTLCMRSMPSLETELEPPAHWTGIFTWIHFRESISEIDRTKRCEIVYSNFMPNRRRRPVSDIFVAFLSTVVRWEAACVAPRLLAF